MNFDKLKKNVISFFSSYKILNNLPDMILYVDFMGNIKDCNIPAKNKFGEIENITINEIFDDGMSAVRQSVKSKSSVLIEIDDEFFELKASKAGSMYCICIRDNTKIIRDNIEKEGIEKFNNEKNAFIVKTQNEIRFPLNSITGFSQGLVDGVGGEVTQKQAKYLKIIQSNANDLAEFANKFLDFSYVESLLYEPDYKQFDIVSEIKNILKEFDKMIISDKICIEYYHNELESRNIFCDINAIKKALVNIFEVVFSTSEKNVYIDVSNPDDEAFITYGLSENVKYVQIKIKDNNNTILPEDIKHVCNPYAQAEKGKKYLLRSFRLGIASILITRVEGHFSISSENGNLYSIIIPIEKEEDE